MGEPQGCCRRDRRTCWSKALTGQYSEPKTWEEQQRKEGDTNDLTTNRNWRLQRIDGGPWRIASAQDL